MGVVIDFIKATLKPPRFPGRANETRTARALHIILWVIVATMAVETPIAWLVPGTPMLGIVINLVLLVGALVLLGVLRLGWVTSVAISLILLIDALILLGNLSYDRPFTTAEVGCILVIFFAGLLSKKHVVITATLTSVLVVAITIWVWLQRPMLVVDHDRMLLDGLGYITLYCVSGCLAYITLRSLRGTFNKLQGSEKMLAQQNTDLAHEIAERRQAEQKQQVVAERQQWMMASLGTVLDAANVLLSAQSLEELWRLAVEIARERLGIERCAVFVRDAQTGDILGTFGTDQHGRSTDERSYRFSPVGPHWQPFLRQDPNYPRWFVDHECDLTGMDEDNQPGAFIQKGWNVLTPISSRDGVQFAMMANDCAISHAPLDEERQNLLAVYCSLLGNIAERKRLETQLQSEAAKNAATHERSRLARELHDSVSQALFGIALGARTAQEQLSNPSEYAREKIAVPISYVLDLSHAALAEMRALIFELRPESLQTEGLIAAFEKQAAALFARHRIVVNTDLGQHEPPLDLVKKEALYRIALEAIQNTIKHAHATQVDLCLAVEQNVVNLDVRDNGQGFDPVQEFPGHLGLQTMRERAEELGGAFVVQSEPQRGTLIRVSMPIANTNGHKPTAE